MNFVKRFVRWEWILPALLLNVFYFFSVSDLGDAFRQSAIAPLEFRFRAWVGKEPSRHEQLKILIYGDLAKRELGLQEQLPLKVWQQVLVDVAARQPRAIYLDKFFSVYSAEGADVEKFKTALQGAPSPVIAAAALGIARDKGSVPLERLFKQWSIAEDARIREGSQETLVGPHDDLADAFSGVGHIRVEDSTTAVEPAWRVSESQRILPQIALAGAQNVRLEKSQIRVDGRQISLDRHGRIPVNFLDRKKIFSGSISFLKIVNPEKRQAELEKINPGDIVLVLPSMYAGTTDVRSSPLGLVEGGIYHASLLNSWVANLYLRPVLQNPLTWFTILLLTALASAAAALWLSQRVSFVLVLLGSLFLLLAGFVGFAWGRILFDWQVLFALFFTNGTLSALVRAILFERQSLRVSTALEGMVSPPVLEALKYKPEILMSRPRSLNVTVLFVDIESFSLRTRNLDPVDVFRILHAQLGLVSETVHQFGGVIDKNLGDGLLCYFGYDIAASRGAAQQNPGEAALQALHCAVEIQRQAAAVTATSKDSPTALGGLLPLRVGLNSGEVFLGNLGAGRRVDFTVVGEAVNTGKRLEDACETFRVLVGETTHRLLASQGKLNVIEGIEWNRRKMSVKHERALVDVWECDPFAADKERYLSAQAVIHGSSVSAFLSEAHIEHAKVTLLQDNVVLGVLLHPSAEKFLIKTKDYFCRKVILQLRILTDHAEINSEIEAQQFAVLNFQVLSGRATGSGEFIHEVIPVNLPSERIETLSRILLKSRYF